MYTNKLNESGSALLLTVHHIPWPMRLSKTDSSMTLEPLQVESKAIVGGWRSVGNPGNGCVLISKPCKSSVVVRGTAEI